jgi:PAS domain S-box-containing protein
LNLSDRLLVVTSAFVFYPLSFLLFRALTGSPLTLLVLIPIATVAWLFGPLAGVAAGIAAWGINLLLQFGSAWLTWPGLLASDSAAWAPVVLTIGLLVGVISRLDRDIRFTRQKQLELEKEHADRLAFLDTLLAANSEGIAIANLNGELIDYNRRFSQLWNVPPQAGGRLNFLKEQQFQNKQLVDPYEFTTRIQRAFQEPGLEQIFEVRMTDGKVLQWETLPRYQDGETCGVIFRLADVTDWTQTKDALMESERYLRWLINHSKEGMVLLNEHGSIFEWNEAMERLSGLKWEEVFRRSMAEVVYYLMPPDQRNPEAMADIRSLWKDMLQRGESLIEPGRKETIMRRTDGKRSFVEVSVLPYQAGSGVMLGVYYRDSTEHKKLADSLRDQMRVARNILNAYPDMAALIDAAGRVLSANQSLLEASGRSTESLMGDHIEEFLPLAVRNEVRSVLEKAAQMETPYYAESQSSGQYFHLTIYPVSSEAGKVNRLVFFLRNITESRQRERELEAVASITSALRAALTRAEVYPIILDQVETLLKADGIGLILRDMNTHEVRVEQARGAWSSLLNMRYSSDQATRGPIMIMDQPYINNNIEKEQHLFQTKPFSGLKATACVPLEIEGQIIGSLWIGRKTMITKEDVRILSALAHITASAAHRAALYENTRQYAEQVSNAAEIGRTLTETLLLDQIYDRLAHTLLKMLPNICTVMILRYDAQARSFTYAYALHDGKTVEKAEIPYLTRFQPGENAFNEIIRTRRPLVMNDLKRRGSTRMITLELNARSGLFAPLVSKGEVLGILQVHSYEKNRFTASDIELFALIGNTAAIAFQNANLFENLHQSHAELTEAYEATLDGWAHALDLRDSGTHGHTRRVVELTVELGRYMGLPDETLVQLRRGALLHDIGKMGVPDDVLKKTGSLTAEEWVKMRKHTTNAYEWLSPIPFLRPALDIPYCHHEKWDGTGYPQGLAGEQIPLAARIFSVIDVWDALLSDRPYRPAWTTEQTMEHLREQRGKQFDPKVVDAFLRMMTGPL